MNFAVVDLETTGGDAMRHRITEVGIVIYDGQKEIERFHTLVNPQKNIPLGIQHLTGITNEMVADAPLFSEISQRVYDLVSGCIFVAHNVHFDFSFLKNELKEAGYSNWNPRKLCTVRYTRKVIPGLKSYSLKNLVSHFGLNNENPHRALSDAIAALQILSEVLKRDTQEVWKESVKLKNNYQFLPQQISASDFDQLSTKAGVYYMKGKGGKNLYIGKAKNIKSRLKSHFTTQLDSEKTQRLLREIQTIDYLETGSEWMAFLFEDQEIRKYWPEFNKAQKVPKRTYGLFNYKDGKGNQRLAVNKTYSLSSSIRSYYSHPAAIQDLYSIRDMYDLNPEYLGIGGNYPFKNHDENVLRFIDDNKVNQAFYVTVKGRNETEWGMVGYKDGLFYLGGYIQKGEEVNSLDSEKIEILVTDSSPTNQWKAQQLLESKEFFEKIEI